MCLLLIIIFNFFYIWITIKLAGNYKMKYIKTKLKNGLCCVLVPTKATKIITIGFFIKVGSRNETDENSGIAHFLEHMMFKGTLNRTAEQLFDELDMLGAVYNAATTTEYTYYYVYGNSNDAKQLLDIMLDIYINTKFITSEINKERKVIIEEMRMRADSPLVKLYHQVHKKMFSPTSLSRNVIGNIQTITNLKKRDLEYFRSTTYQPENTIFVVTGNFVPEPILRIIKKPLQTIKKCEYPMKLYTEEKSIILNNMSSQKNPYYYVKQDQTLQQAYVLIVFPMYDLYNNYSEQISLLSQLLSAGFSSRLNRSLRENNGITYVSGSYPISYTDCGLFMIQMVLNPLILVPGLKIVFSELKKTKTELMTENEMKKILNFTKNSSLYSLTRPTELLKYIGINFLTDKDFKPNIKKEFNKLQTVTRAQIKEIAGKIFLEEKINLFIYGNTDICDFSFVRL